MPDTGDRTMAILKAAREQDGAEAAVQVAKHMIEAAAAWIAHEEGPDATRRFLEIVGAAQGPSAS